MKKKSSLHPRNRHQGHYDFDVLKASYPELAHFVAKNKYGNDSIDFAHPEAIKALNRALLKSYYGISEWNIPKDYLCPPIPGRADYIHQLADLLASSNEGLIPRGRTIRVLDIGVGANCIYPIIGHHEYEWSFLGSDSNPASIQSAQTIAQSNPSFGNAVDFKLQESSSHIFEGIIGAEDRFDASLCNPPFHASLEEAQAGTRRKWNHLGKKELSQPKHKKQLINFGGKGLELWCDGGEVAFIRQMIQESARFAYQCFWFSTLVSKEDNLPKIYKLLKTAKVKELRTLNMTQGQKKSRIVAWTFLNPLLQKEWRNSRWGLKWGTAI